MPTTASDPVPGATSGADRDPVQPVAQQVGVADRPGLPGQDQEDGLEHILGMLQVAEGLLADA